MSQPSTCKNHSLGSCPTALCKLHSFTQVVKLHPSCTMGSNSTPFMYHGVKPHPFHVPWGQTPPLSCTMGSNPTPFMYHGVKPHPFHVPWDQTPPLSCTMGSNPTPHGVKPRTMGSNPTYTMGSNPTYTMGSTPPLSCTESNSTR